MKTIGFLFLLLVALITGSAQAQPSRVLVQTLRCEYRLNPLGIDVPQPRLSWVLTSDARGQKQSAYRVLVASGSGKLAQDRGDLWDSGIVDSDQSIQVVYAGKPLGSQTKAHWKVRIWDQAGHLSAWSEPAMWAMGLLGPMDWKAQWIGDAKAAEVVERLKSNPPRPAEAPAQTNAAPATTAILWPGPAPSEMPAPLLRKEFVLTQSVKDARVYVCGLGYYELYLNGQRVGDHVLDPGFTGYDKRILYSTYDVTRQLRSGTNALGLMLGCGWSPIGLGRRRADR